ncbi:unnamed protein product [Paramecium pentaurelia]|uniref:Uncharacterized protein n=1 Tax=Paramecium pentaurelia TaxID=43138 RepID=A0A8S1VD24_9CILI|nr:unnamed protein product [Paramecium pentaurelia]
MNDNLGILNNRFHMKAIQNRKRFHSVDQYSNSEAKEGKKKNEYYQRWLTNQKECHQKIPSESNIESFTPSTPQAQIPIQLEPKLLKDIMNKYFKAEQ